MRPGNLNFVLVYSSPHNPTEWQVYAASNLVKIKAVLAWLPEDAPYTIYQLNNPVETGAVSYAHRDAITSASAIPQLTEPARQHEVADISSLSKKILL